MSEKVKDINEILANTRAYGFHDELLKVVLKYQKRNTPLIDMIGSLTIVKKRLTDIESERLLECGL